MSIYIGYIEIIGRQSRLIVNKEIMIKSIMAEPPKMESGRLNRGSFTIHVDKMRGVGGYLNVNEGGWGFIQFWTPIPLV